MTSRFPRRLALLAALTAALAASAVAGCGGDDEGEGDGGRDSTALEVRLPDPFWDTEQAAGTHVGKVEGERDYIAVVLHDDQAAIYVCDGRSFDWFGGPVEDDRFDITSESGTHVEAAVSGERIEGTVAKGDGPALAFTASPPRGEAGLYAAADPTLPGGTRRWIVLEDGVRGVSGSEGGEVSEEGAVDAPPADDGGEGEQAEAFAPLPPQRTAEIADGASNTIAFTEDTGDGSGGAPPPPDDVAEPPDDPADAEDGDGAAAGDGADDGNGAAADDGNGAAADGDGAADGDDGAAAGGGGGEIRVPVFTDEVDGGDDGGAADDGGADDDDGGAGGDDDGGAGGDDGADDGEVDDDEAGAPGDQGADPDEDIPVIEIPFDGSVNGIAAGDGADDLPPIVQVAPVVPEAIDDLTGGGAGGGDFQTGAAGLPAVIPDPTRGELRALVRQTGRPSRDGFAGGGLLGCGALARQLDGLLTARWAYLQSGAQENAITAQRQAGRFAAQLRLNGCRSAGYAAGRVGARYAAQLPNEEQGSGYYPGSP